MKIINIKVPQNKQIFFSLPADKISSLLEWNKNVFNQYSFTIISQPFKEVRENSQKEVVQRALGFSKKFDPDIAEKIKAINNFMVEKARPLKCELSKKLEDEEER